MAAHNPHTSNSPRLMLLVIALVLGGCGTSHLDCDTKENEILVKNAVNQVIDEYLQRKNLAKETQSASQVVYPALVFGTFNQFVVDMNATKCDYILNATFEQSAVRVSGIHASAVFRSTSTGGKTHELIEFAIEPGDAVKLGIAAIKSSQ